MYPLHSLLLLCVTAAGDSGGKAQCTVSVASSIMQDPKTTGSKKVGSSVVQDYRALLSVIPLNVDF